MVTKRTPITFIDSLPPTYRSHPDWPGYGGDPQGNVYSTFPGHRIKKLNPWKKTKDEHLFVSLRKDGKTHKIGVGRFILEIFVGLRPEGMETCHGDQGPSVNSVHNLRWDTQSENTIDRCFQSAPRPGERRRLTPGQAKQAILRRKTGEPLNSIARDLGVTETTISHIDNCITWKRLPR